MNPIDGTKLRAWLRERIEDAKAGEKQERRFNSIAGTAEQSGVKSAYLTLLNAINTGSLDLDPQPGAGDLRERIRQAIVGDDPDKYPVVYSSGMDGDTTGTYYGLSDAQIDRVADIAAAIASQQPAQEQVVAVKKAFQNFYLNLKSILTASELSDLFDFAKTIAALDAPSQQAVTDTQRLDFMLKTNARIHGFDGSGWWVEVNGEHVGERCATQREAIDAASAAGDGAYTGRGNGPNYSKSESGEVLICRGHHSKSDACHYEQATAEEIAAMQADTEKSK